MFITVTVLSVCGGGPAAPENPGALKFSVLLSIPSAPWPQPELQHGCRDPGDDGHPALSWPGLPSPKPAPRKSPASPTPALVGPGSVAAGPGPSPSANPCPAPGLLSYLTSLPHPRAQRQGLLCRAAPSVYYCLRRPLLVLRESPSLEWGLVPTLLSLSGIRIQPFWGI